MEPSTGVPCVVETSDLETGSGGARHRSGERLLSRADWIETALDLLVAEGVGAVKITRLAGTMAVTRGSFYWHFKDRNDLLEALVDRWESKNTAAIVAALEGAEDLTNGVLALFDVWTDIDQFDPRLDAAMRDWARHAIDVRVAVEAGDERRLRAITRKFIRAGYGAAEARIRARIIYFSQVGYYALEIEETLGQRVAHIEDYFEGFTGRALDPDSAAAYRAKYRGRIDGR